MIISWLDSAQNRTKNLLGREHVGSLVPSLLRL